MYYFFLAVFLERVVAPEEDCLALLSPLVGALLPSLPRDGPGADDCTGVPSRDTAAESRRTGGCGSSPPPERRGLDEEGVPGAVEGLLCALGKGEEGLKTEAAFAIGGCDENEVLRVTASAFARSDVVRFEVAFFRLPL